MKKGLMTITAFCALSAVSAQEVAVSEAKGGFSVSLSLGYAGAAAGETIGTDKDVTSATAFTEKNISGTYGGGIPITLGLGYMFNNNLGLDLGINYFMGSEVTSDITTTFLGDGSKTTSKGYQIRVIPQIVISTSTEEALGFYVKTGVLLPVVGETTFKVDATSTSTTTGVQSAILVEGTSAGAFSFGYTGSLGTSFRLNDNLSLFGELQGINLRMKATSQTWTSYTVDGTDMSDMLPVSATTINYVDELTATSNMVATEPTDELGTTTNYNSLGFSIGVKYKF